jgi:hypothetical protein
MLAMITGQRAYTRNKNSKGHAASFDIGEGNHFDAERRKSPSIGVYLAYGKRFCETCQQAKPKHGVAKKGWKCADCKNI